MNFRRVKAAMSGNQTSTYRQRSRSISPIQDKPMSALYLDSYVCTMTIEHDKPPSKPGTWISQHSGQMIVVVKRHRCHHPCLPKCCFILCRSRWTRGPVKWGCIEG